MKLRICLCCLLLLALPVSAMAAEVESGGVYCFSQEDFGEDTAVFLRQVPENGTLTLGTRCLRAGDALTEEQLSRLRFTPHRTEEDGGASVGYLPVKNGSLEPEATLTIGIRGKENKVPVAEDSALETYRNLSSSGAFRAKDPEGEALTFAIVRQPRRGTVTIAEGGFTYTPSKNKVGVDSFTYTATDPQGKVSREATVTVTILKPTNAPNYEDTVDTSCRFTAEWMRSTGIFAGETLAGSAYFGPEKQVNRGEFLTMVVKTLSIPVEQQVSAEIRTNLPQWLRPYAAAALRSGLTAGTVWQGDFDPLAPVSTQEAAALLCACLDLEGVDAVKLLTDSDFPLPEEGTLTRETAANLLYKLHQAAKV